MADPLQVFIDTLEASQGDFEDRILKTVEIGQRNRMYKKNDLNDQAASLDNLAKLVTDKNSLDNFVNVSTNISNEMREFPGLVPQANVIEQFTSNMSNDYSMYSTTMEQGATLIDSMDFLEDADDWVDLNKSVKNIPIEDGETPKYEGTFEYLTAMNNKINTIQGRLANSTKGNQFRYNKNAKYQDHEIGEKLDKLQKRLSVAVETSLDNDVITQEEAQYIMLGRLDVYQDKKEGRLREINSAYKMINSRQKRIQDTMLSIEKGEINDGNSFSVSKLLQEQMGEEYSDATSTTAVELKDKLSKINKELALSKTTIQDQYEAWAGDKMPLAKSSPAGGEEDDDYKSKVYSTQGDKKKTVDVTKIDLDVKGNKWAYDPPTSHREDYEKGSMSDDVNSPIYAIDGVYQYPELFEEKKEKLSKLTYDPAMGGSIEERNRNRVKKYGLTIQELGELEDAWTEENTGQTFDAYLDSFITPTSGKDSIEEKGLSSEEQLFKSAEENFDLLKTGHDEASDNLSKAEKKLRQLQRSVDRGFEYDKDRYSDLKSEVKTLKGVKGSLFKQLEKALEKKQKARKNITAASSEEFYRKKATEYLSKRGLKRTDKNWKLAMKYAKDTYSANWTAAISEPIISGAENISQYLRRILK